MMEAIKNNLGKEEYAILSKKIEEKGLMTVLGKELIVNKKLREIMISAHKGGKERRSVEKKGKEFRARLKSHHNSSGS